MTRWTTAADKHNVSRESVQHVLDHTAPIDTICNDGTPGLLYIGPDHTGEEIEVITVEIPGDRLVIHAMPFGYRRK